MEASPGCRSGGLSLRGLIWAHLSPLSREMLALGRARHIEAAGPEHQPGREPAPGSGPVGGGVSSSGVDMRVPAEERRQQRQFGPGVGESQAAHR
jgi:hypothetical protein